MTIILQCIIGITILKHVATVATVHIVRYILDVAVIQSYPIADNFSGTISFVNTI